jgi:hypothetical protein
MSRARLASTVPVLALLGYLFYSGSKKAAALAPSDGGTLKGFDDLGKFHFSAPKISVKSVLKTAINPVAQIKVAQSTFAKNKFMNDAMNAAKTIANPIEQVKKTKDILVNAAHSKSGITHWALVASDPVQQQRAIKGIMNARSQKKKDAAAAAAAQENTDTTFPYQVEPGIWIDKDGNQVNQDGSAYVAPVAVADPGTGQPPIYYGDQPSTDAGVDNSGAQTDPNAPYYDPSSGLWYNPPTDQYFDQATGQLYDGYLNPINKQGMITGAPDRPDYSRMPSTDHGPILQSTVADSIIFDTDSGLWYDYQTDTYFDDTTNQYYDGYMNPIDPAQASALQGLGSFKFHIAKGAPLKAAAVVGAAAAIVGCIYASGGCAVYISAEAALAAAAWHKSHPSNNPNTPQLAAVNQYQNQQAQNQVGLAQTGKPYYDTTSGYWYDPGSDTYYDPATKTEYGPDRKPHQTVDNNGLVPATY